MSIFPVIPTDYKTLKNACRKGLSHESRQYWWPLLTQVAKDSLITEYPDIDGTSERLTNLVCEYFAGGANSVSFEWKTEVVMKSLQKRRGMEHPDLVSKLIRIIAECIPQIEVCFLIGSDLLSQPERYVQPTALGHGCRLHTFTEVLRRYLPKTAAILEDIGALRPLYLNLMFVDFFRTLLPRQSVLALLDAYLLEGWRILLRYGLSLIKGYKAQIKARRFSSGEEFWQAVQASARSMSASIDTSKVESILQAIKINSFDVERPMIERLYRPMNISGANIERLMGEGKKVLQNARPTDITVFESKVVPRMSMYAETRLSARVATDDTGASSHPTSSRNNSHDSEVYGLVSGAESEKNRPLFEYMCQKSDILLIEDTSRLLQMLPPQLISEGLELAFSTTRSGWALGSLYSEVRDLRPCVLIIQTLPQPKPKLRNSESLPPPSPGRTSEGSISHTSESGLGLKKQVEGGQEDPILDDDDDDDTNFGEDDADRGVILGVYLPCPLAPPSTSVRGDREAFVFRLTDGITGPTIASTPNLKGAKFLAVANPRKSTNGPPGSEAAALVQYAVCASSYMSFGASSKHSTNALRIDEELRWVASGPSDTYASPPLLLTSECDANAMLGLTMVPVKRGSFTSFSPALRPSRSRSQSQENAGLNLPVPATTSSTSSSSSGPPNLTLTLPTGPGPTAPLSPTSGSPSVFEVDKRASIKQIEVWCGRNSVMGRSKPNSR